MFYPKEVYFHSEPKVPDPSPIKKNAPRLGHNQDYEDSRLASAETSFYKQTAVRATAEICAGDALMGIISRIRSEYDLRIVIRYIIRYSNNGSLGSYTQPSNATTIAREALSAYRDILITNIENSGGAELIIEKTLDSLFPETPDGHNKDNESKPEGYWYRAPEQMMGTLDELRGLDKVIACFNEFVEESNDNT